MSTVYALIDPVTNEAKYVGITAKNLSYRLDAHCKWGSVGVTQWVSSLNGARPSIVALEENVTHDEDESERFWIAYLKCLGANLLNVHGGGRRRQSHPFEESEIIARYIKFDEEKWDSLVELARGKGTTAAALVRGAAYSILKRGMTPLEETS